MYNDKIFLTPNEILEKEFKVDARGYRPQEVDKYLDVIMRDYEEFISIIKEQNHEIKQLTEDNLQLKQEIRILRTKIEALKDTDSDSGSSNVDVLKRLSNLEKIIYGK